MTVSAIDVRFFRDVFESSSAAIVVENVLRTRESARSAHHGNALPDTSWTLTGSGCCGQIEVDVIGHDEIQLPVSIVVHEGTTCAPSLARSGHSRLFCDFGEYTVIVVIELVLTVIGNVEIFPSVVIVVADANALSPTRCGETSLCSHIREGAVVIVVVETVRGPLARWKTLQPCAIHQKNVRPSVMVVVEYRHAVAGGLNDVLFGINPAENVLRGESGLLRFVGKVRDWRAGRGALRWRRDGQGIENQ